MSRYWVGLGALSPDRTADGPPKPFLNALMTGRQDSRGGAGRDDSDLDGELPTRLPERVVGDPALCRWAQDGSSRHVELGAMPGAGDDLAVKRALGQRAATMWTGVVDRIAAAAHIEDRD